MACSGTAREAEVKPEPEGVMDPEVLESLLEAGTQVSGADSQGDANSALAGGDKESSQETTIEELSDTEPSDKEPSDTVEKITEEEQSGEPSDQEGNQSSEREAGSHPGIIDGVLKYEDVHGYFFRTPVHDDWPMNEYDLDAFVMADGRMTYDSEKYTYRLGIDVYNEYGSINWDEVKKDGYEFAIIRAGYRGYAYPDLITDPNIYSYMHGAVNAGMDLGLYFFSQAITEQEAQEEADFVLGMLDGQGCRPENLVMGVAYDPESIGLWSARTASLTKEQATKNAAAFCKKISDAGYRALVYSNMVWEDRYFDLSQLTDYEIWYADYTAYPQTPYKFSIWQYGHGASKGIEGAVDVNIELIPVEEDTVTAEAASAQAETAPETASNP